MGVRMIAAAAAGVAAMFLAGAAELPATVLDGAAAPAPPASPAASATAGSATPAPAGRVLERADLEAWLDGVVPYILKDGDIAGAVVVVVKDGAVLLQKGYGYADVAARTPMDPERSRIRPGSTSKLFTWVAVMQLVEQGRLDLDRDVGDYLDFKIPKKFDKPITLRDLMNHRAGFEEGLKDVLAIDPRNLQSTETYLKRHPRPQLFAPGEVPAYSNYGAALAGYIVERVSGEKFERYVERHIFAPLGMTSATFDQPLPARFGANMAKGYRTASGPAEAYELLITRPAGSMTVTALDMAPFMIANLQQGAYGDARILSPEMMRRTHTPSHAQLPGFAAMAHGYFHDQRNGQTIVGHGGDSVFFHTEMSLLPSEGVGIFYSFNSRGAGDSVYAARAAIFDGFMDRYFPAPPRGPDGPPLATAVKDAREIAGRYRSSRRVEHGFIALFYMLQQTTITANADGTISAPDAEGVRKVTLREVGPQIWREVGGERQLALRTVGGIKTVIDSQNPTAVLHPAPFLRSAPLTLTVLGASLAILIWTLLLWPLTWLLRRGDRAEPGVPAETRRLRLFSRGAAAGGLVYLTGWYLLLSPILATRLEVFNTGLDPVVMALNVAGLLVVALAGLAVWVAWRMFSLGAPWTSRLWSAAVAAAMLGVVWIAVMGQLISFNLNY